MKNNLEKFKQERLKEQAKLFNKILHQMYNLEIVPEIQSRINERIPECGGFQLFQSDDMQSFLSETIDMLAEKMEKEFITKIENSLARTTLSYNGDFFVGMTSKDWDKLKQSLNGKETYEKQPESTT